MNNQRSHLRTAVAAAVLATAGMTSFSALAASSRAGSAQVDRASIQQTYRAERAACTDGSSTQEKSACLAEASAVRKEALRGELGLQTVARNEKALPGSDDLFANALSRCDAVPGDVRGLCERRIMGDDVIVVGSVAEGVIVRELPVQEPAVVATAAPAAPAAASEPVLVAEATEPVMPALEAEPAGESLYAARAEAEAAADEAAVVFEPTSQPQLATLAPATAQDTAQDVVPTDMPANVEDEPGQLPAPSPIFVPEDRASSSLEPSPYPMWMRQQRFE